MTKVGGPAMSPIILVFGRFFFGDAVEAGASGVEEVEGWASSAGG